MPNRIYCDFQFQNSDSFLPLPNESIQTNPGGPRLVNTNVQCVPPARVPTQSVCIICLYIVL